MKGKGEQLQQMQQTISAEDITGEGLHPLIENTPLEHFTVDMFFDVWQWYYLLFNLLGIGIYILQDLAKEQLKEGEFKFKDWWKENSFKTLLSILTSWGVMFIFVSYGVMNIALAIIIGFGSDAIFKLIIKKLKLKSNANNDESNSKGSSNDN